MNECEKHSILKSAPALPNLFPPGNPSRTVCVCVWRVYLSCDESGASLTLTTGGFLPAEGICFPSSPPSLLTFIHCECSLTHWKPTVSAAHKFSLVRAVRPAGLKIDDTSRRLRASQGSDRPLGEWHVARVWPNLTNKKPQQTSFANPETIEVKRKLVKL